VIERLTVKARVLGPADEAEARRRDEENRARIPPEVLAEIERQSEGYVEEDDWADAPSPQVGLVTWYEVLLSDGRVIEGPTASTIGTGVSEAEVSVEALLESVDRFDRDDFARRWDRLIEALEAHGVRATPTELDALERTIEIDMGHLG
jgi:hypothetical protein